MSLDAIVYGVRKSGDNLIVTLVPRIDNDGQETLPGQPFQIVDDYTARPSIGSAIWGGSGSVIMDGRRYIRDGAMTLRENFE